MLIAQVHSIGELERVLQLELEGTMLGINNRDLQTFNVDLDNSKIILTSTAGQEVRLDGTCILVTCWPRRCSSRSSI